MKLPKNLDPKWILIALAVVVVLVLVYFFWSKTEKAQKTKENNEVIEKLNKEIDPEKITISTVQLEALATKMCDAIYGLGTNFTAIKDVFKQCKTRSDILALAATYHSLCNDKWFYGGSLWQDLSGDLDESQKAEINEILEYKNVDFKI